LSLRLTLYAAQHGVALLGNNSATPQIAKQHLVDRRGDELELVEILVSDILTMVSWF